MNQSILSKKRKWDWIAVSAIFAALAVSSLWLYQKQKPEPVTAVITLDGDEIMRIPLSGYQGIKTVSLDESYGVPVHFEINGDQIRFAEVTCPDHICEKAGYLSKPYDTAVCMPNRVAVSLFADSELSP